VKPADLPAICARARAVRPLKDAANVHRPLLLSTLTAAAASAADVPALVAEVETWRTLFSAFDKAASHCFYGSAEELYDKMRAMLPTKGPTHDR
jgi:hypothetical protein